MAKDYYDTPNKQFGESLKYDPTFKGPLHKRSCTDVICLLIFIVFIGGWVAVGVYAFRYGDPVRLLTPTDSAGRRCGLDEEVKDKPYLFYFDLTKCARPDIVISGCPTPQVCVRACPTTPFLLNKETNIAVMRNEIICKTEVNVPGISSVTEALNKVDSGDCARYNLPSNPVQRRCIPIDNVDAKYVIDSVVAGGFELLFGIVSNFTDDQKYQEVQSMQCRQLLGAQIDVACQVHLNHTQECVVLHFSTDTKFIFSVPL